VSLQHSVRTGRVPGYLGRLTVLGVVVAASAAVAVQPASARILSRRQARKLEAMVSSVSKPGHASLANGRALGGFTTQGNPFVATVAKNGKKLGMVASALNLTCTSGDQFTIVDGWAGLPIGHGGTVGKSLSIPPTVGSGSAAGITITGGADTFSGKLNRKKATFTGTWDLQFDLTLASGQTDQCDSGNVGFKAVL
jgi:hypothetical protein